MPAWIRHWMLTQVSSTAAFSLLNGGTAGFIYIYITMFIGFGMVIISMAEMVSMYIYLNNSAR